MLAYPEHRHKTPTRPSLQIASPTSIDPKQSQTDPCCVQFRTAAIPFKHAGRSRQHIYGNAPRRLLWFMVR